jgi:PAS domain S-box-containing protein
VNRRDEAELPIPGDGDTTLPIDRSPGIAGDPRRGLDRMAAAVGYLELTRELVCTAGFDGYLKWLNAAWTQTLGWTEDELRGRRLIDLVHPADRARTERETGRLAEALVVDYVNRLATKAGGWIWLEWRAMGMPDQGVIHATARDITDRRETEAALDASERRASQSLDVAPDALVTLDGDGLITGWNARAQDVFGWSRAEVIGQEMCDRLIPQAGRVGQRREIERFAATGAGRLPGRRQELMMLHRDGYEFLIEMTMSTVEDADGYSFIAFLRDITERRRAEAELALARDRALDASRMKSMFVANMSHEIRTPMNGVIGMTELLLDTQLDDEQRQYVEAISSSGDALLSLIDDILDLSKVEAGRLALDPTVFYVRDAIAQACGMLAVRAREKGIELVVETDSVPPGPVRGDGVRLRQVITNLVSNAVKFTARGRVVVHLSSEPTDDGRAALVRVAVTDTGIGIEPATLKHLFEPFRQADSSTTRKYGGSGLGLAISRHLIELMGGVVGAESQPGRGSTFWLELSLDRAGATDQPEEDRGLAGRRILVVDDRTRQTAGGLADVGAVARQLRAWRTACEVAGSAGSVLEILDSSARAGLAYELVVLDLASDDDARDIVDQLRSRPALADICVVMLAALGRPADAIPVAGIDGILAWPAEPHALFDEIQSVLAGRPPGAVGVDLGEPVGDSSMPGEAGPLVLVVEDTPVNQAVATLMLEKRGYRSDVAENGRLALIAMSQRSYAAVLMDCQMPELDGFETTTEIRRLERDGRPRVPIIAMTASTMHGERERCLAAGMDDYLTKPLRGLTLKATLARWIPDPDGRWAGAGATAHANRRVGATPSTNRPAAARAGPALLDETILADLDALGDGILSELVPLYLSDSAACIAELAAAVGRGDAPAVAASAHRLKGASRSVGAAGVGAIAEELELGAKAGELAAAGTLLAGLGPALAETVTAFDQRAATRGSTGGIDS